MRDFCLTSVWAMSSKLCKPDISPATRADGMSFARARSAAIRRTMSPRADVHPSRVSARGKGARLRGQSAARMNSIGAVTGLKPRPSAFLKTLLGVRWLGQERTDLLDDL